jgi:hypothetical protein
LKRKKGVVNYWIEHQPICHAKEEQRSQTALNIQQVAWS